MHMALKAPGILDLHAVHHPVAGSAVLALLRRHRALCSPATRRSSTPCGPPISCCARLHHARAVAPRVAAAAIVARRQSDCADLSRGFWRSGKAAACRALYLGDGERSQRCASDMAQPRRARAGPRDCARRAADGRRRDLHHRGAHAAATACRSRARRRSRPRASRRRTRPSWRRSLRVGPIAPSSRHRWSSWRR